MNKSEKEINSDLCTDPITILDSIKEMPISELEEMDIYYILDLIIEIGIKLEMFDKSNRIVDEGFIDMNGYDLNKLGTVLLDMHAILLKFFQHYELI